MIKNNDDIDKRCHNRDISAFILVLLQITGWTLLQRRSSLPRWLQ